MLFCEECGARIEVGEKMPGIHYTVFSRKDKHKPETVDLSTAPIGGNDPGIWKIILQLLDKDVQLTFEGQNEITLGRGDESQGILPDGDFSAHNGYELGVSRMHAALSISGSEVRLVDLGSANGTRLNGVRINPHAACTLKDGDEITLGRLRFKLVIQR